MTSNPGRRHSVADAGSLRQPREPHGSWLFFIQEVDTVCTLQEPTSVRADVGTGVLGGLAQDSPKLARAGLDLG